MQCLGLVLQFHSCRNARTQKGIAKATGCFPLSLASATGSREFPLSFLYCPFRKKIKETQGKIN